MADWKYAGFAALLLFGAAAFVLFVIHPGGFEEQVGWFVILMPGVLVAGLIAGQKPLLASALAWLGNFCRAEGLYW